MSEPLDRAALLGMSKEELEARKLALEIDRIAREGRIERNAKWFVPIAVALVSVTISGTQLWMAISKDATERITRHEERLRTEEAARAERERTQIAEREQRARMEREEERQAISTGITLANFAINNQDVFASSDQPRIRRFVAIVEKTFPDRQRTDLLAALNAGASAAEVFEIVAQSAGRSLSPGQQERVEQAIVAASPMAGNGDGQQRSYRIYFHFIAKDDRIRVNELAQGLPAHFFSQGVELKEGARISRRGPIEVRHYKADQKADAEALGDHLKAAVRQATGCVLEVAISDLSPRWPRLPDGRMEVWLGDLPDRC